MDGKKPRPTGGIRAKSTRGKTQVPVTPVDAEALRRLRSQLDWNQEQLCEKSRVSIQTISRLEREPNVADTSTVVALAKALGVPVGTLLGEEPGNLDKVTAPPEVMRHLEEFVNRLFRTAQGTTKFLDAFTRYLEGDPDKVVTVMGTIDVEEEILGLWSSILHAYEGTDWGLMVQKTNALAEVAQRVGRPYLGAVAHAYAAKALRNTGNPGAMRQARSMLEKVPESARSPLLSRLRGKILEREENLEGALKCYEESLELSKKSPREDMLYALEKVKLLRNLVDLRVKMARRCNPEQKEARSTHLQVAGEYLPLAEAAIKVLRTHSANTAEMEEGMLSFSRARHLEAQGRFEEARKLALVILNRQVAARSLYSVAKTHMFLIHVCIEAEKLDEACTLYASLRPLRPYFTRRLWMYHEEWVKPQEETIRKHLPKGRPEVVPAKFEPPSAILALTGIELPTT